MPILIILGICGVMGATSIADRSTVNTNVSKDVIHTMNRQMVGKSQRECRKIVRRYMGR